METPNTLPAVENGVSRLQAEAARLFALQKAHQQQIRHTTARQRLAKLKRLRAGVHAHRANIRDALYADFSKSPEEADLTEILVTLVEIRHMRQHLRRWMRPRKVRTPLTLLGTSSEIRYEPKGVGLIISPWNYPINLTLGPLVGAIGAGCCVIIKPSEFTPNTSEVMKTLLGKVFDEQEVAILEGDHRAAQALLKLPFDHMYFTGSPEVGKIVMRAAADHLASVTLELGGKSPTIVDETADVNEAAMKIVFGKFSNKGQTCIAPDYVYVHESLHDAFVEALQKYVHRFYGKDAEARSSTGDYARIINDRHHTRLRELYERAVAEGARVATGATSKPGDRYIDPTVLTNVQTEAEIMQEEIFGPLLPILKYRDLEEVLTTIQSKTKPLALYIFTKNNRNVERILHNTSAGGTCVNDTLLHFMHPELPFGGVNTSGIGKGHGYHGFLAFSNERPLLRQRLKNAPFQYFYPPYTPMTRKLIDGLLKFF